MTALLDTPEREICSRLNQAAHLLQGTDAPAEVQLLRQSFLDQPQYFTQPFDIIYEDGHFMICNKPFDTQIANGVTQSARFEDETTLVELAAACCSAGDHDSPCLKPCHQLDFATSGVLVLAKTDAALSAGSLAFDSSSSRPPGAPSVQKEYLAAVFGWPEWDETQWSGSIAADPSSEFKMMRVEADETSVGLRPLPAAAAAAAPSAIIDGNVATRWGPSRMPPAASWAATRSRRAASKPKAAHTHLVVERRGRCALRGPLHGAKVSLVRLRPTTGRRHQLRVTLADLGHPIVGDVSYAGDLSSYRLMLHADAITVVQPPLTERGEEEEAGHLGRGEEASVTARAARVDAGTNFHGADGPNRSMGRRARARARKAAAAKASATNPEAVLRPLAGRRFATGGEPFADVVA